MNVRYQSRLCRKTVETPSTPIEVDWDHDGEKRRYVNGLTCTVEERLSGSIAGKNFHRLWPAIGCMVRGYDTSRDSADRTCQMSVWICKEQVFRLVCRMVLPYTLSKKKERIREDPVVDDSIPYRWHQRANAHWTTIHQGVPLVLADRSGAVRHLYG